MKVVVLAGGMGTRLAEETEVRPKPMVEVGGRPLLWHIMKIYAQFGHQEFVVALADLYHRGRHPSSAALGLISVYMGEIRRLGGAETDREAASTGETLEGLRRRAEKGRISGDADLLRTARAASRIYRREMDRLRGKGEEES